MKSNDWVTVEARVAFRISDLSERTGGWPLAFQKCLIAECDQLAVYLVCAVYHDRVVRPENRFADASAEALAQELRAEFDTALEIPVCELHLGSTLRQ